MIKDRAQKELLYKHFRAQGWLAQIEVPVVSTIGVSPKAPPITDIDVLGIRASQDLKWQYVVGDCKTRKAESPVNRVLWARGLSEAIGAASAIVLLQREAGSWIERDHKLVADQHNVLLIQENEFEAYDKAIIYPTGSSGWREGLTSFEVVRDGIPQKFPQLKNLTRWLLSDSFAISDHSVLLRRVIVELSDHRGELDPRRDDHLALIVEGCLVFSVAFATLVGTIFRRYIQPDQRANLEEAVRVLIWGGREQYEFYQRLRRDFMGATGNGTEPLVLPEWGRFLELIRAVLDAPRQAFRIPQFLRRLSTGIISNTAVPVVATERDKLLIQFTLRLVEYVCRATRMPVDALTRIQTLLIERLTEIMEMRTHVKHFTDTQQSLQLGVEEQRQASQQTNTIAAEVHVPNGEKHASSTRPKSTSTRPRQTPKKTEKVTTEGELQLQPPLDQSIEPNID